MPKTAKIPAAIMENSVAFSGSEKMAERPINVRETNKTSLSEIPIAINAPFLNPCSMLLWIKRKKLGPIAKMNTSPKRSPFKKAGIEEL